MSRKKIQPPKEELESCYLKEGSTISSVARHYETSNPTIRKWLKEYDIPLKSHKVASTEANNRHRKEAMPSKEEFQFLYDEYNSMRDLERHYKVSQETVYRWIEILEIKQKSFSERSKESHHNRFLDRIPGKNEILEAYRGDVTIGHLCERFKVSTGFMRKIMRHYGIQAERKRVSAVQKEIFEYLGGKSFGWVLNDRSIISPLEIDIYNPELKLGIEYCGSFWHCESSGKGKTYHQDKWKLMNDKGCRLITIFEGEWEKPQTKMFIQSVLGGKPSIGARECSIMKISPQQARKFQEKWHIQGKVNAISHSYGLYHEGELVAEMSFGKDRFSKTERWELFRYTLGGFAISGAAEKLFKQALKDLGDIPIISYCDLRYGDGGVYKRLGFENTGITKPGYWYFNKRTFRGYHNRVLFQKHKLSGLLNDFDPAKTEYENMKENGYDRIWDCGNGIWEFDKTV